MDDDAKLIQEFQRSVQFMAQVVKDYAEREAEYAQTGLRGGQLPVSFVSHGEVATVNTQAHISALRARGIFLLSNLCALYPGLEEVFWQMRDKNIVPSDMNRAAFVRAVEEKCQRDLEAIHGFAASLEYWIKCYKVAAANPYDAERNEAVKKMCCFTRLAPQARILRDDTAFVLATAIYPCIASAQQEQARRAAIRDEEDRRQRRLLQLERQTARIRAGLPEDIDDDD